MVTIVKPGYRQTEVGIIPEGWDMVPLGIAFSISAGGDLDKESFSKDQDDKHPFPIYSNSLTNKGLYGYSSIYQHDKDVVTVTARGTIGMANARDHPFCAIGRLLILKPAKKLDCVFMTEYINHRVKFTHESTGVPQLTAPQISKYFVALPKPDEQSTIAKVLSNTDELIEKLENLIEKKKNIKQGVMQDLLTSKRRLPGFRKKWEVKSFDKLFKFLNTANNPRADFSTFGDIGYIHYGDIHTTTSTFLNTAIVDLPLIEKTRVTGIPFIKDGDLVMVDASEDYSGIGKCVEIGNVGNQKIVAGLHTLLLRGDKEQLADGFKGYLQFIPNVKASLIKLATGISVYGISKNNVKRIEVLLPHVEEQSAIAQILSDMGTEIEDLEKKREKYIMIKNGMMQQLLTGRIRLR